MCKNEKYNFAKIDSYTLLIPIDTVNVVSSTFLQKYSKLYSTGEIEENSKEFYNHYEKTENSETKTFLKYKRIFRMWNGESVEFIQIMVTSKLLTKKYFEGLNFSNFKTIYDYINNDGIIHITEENLQNAYVVDIDICKDFKLDLDAFKDLKNMLLENVLQEKESLLNSKRINSKEVFGVQYNERHKATPSKPFVKLYFKSFELKSEKTLPFTTANLFEFENEINEGIGRMEVTIKNSKHKERLGITEVKRLKELYALNQEELDSIFSKIIAEYYTKRSVLKQKTERMSPNDLIIKNLLECIMRYNKNLTTEEIVFITVKDASDRKQKSVIKAKTLEILTHLKDYKSVKRNDSEKTASIEVMRNLGIFDALD